MCPSVKLRDEGVVENKCLVKIVLKLKKLE